MINYDASREIGELKARCMLLESKMAALAAFACAILEAHPQQDQLQTRWANHLGPAMDHFLGTLDEPEKTAVTLIPGWVHGHLDSGKSHQ